MLVGRDPELRVVDALVAGARIGHSGVLVVTGEAGIGKTSLLAYAAERASGMRLLRAAGAESERGVAFGGLLQLLRATPGDLDRIPPPQAQALGVALALREGAGVDRFAVGAATLSLLTRFSEDSPLGLVIDDVHQLDLPSADAITFAARRLLADPVFVIAAAREGEPDALTAAGLPVLRLGGLDAIATRQLAMTRTRAPTTPEQSRRLHQVTGGNPLAIVDMASDVSPLSATAPDLPAPVPARLAQRFAERATGLGPDVRTLLLIAATSGGDLSVVQRASASLGVQVALLSAAEEAGLVRVEENRIEFFHPLVRSAVYATASATERRSLHTAVADALPETATERRAWHRASAALGPDEATAAALEDVARRSSDRGAYAVAAAAYERSAQLSPGDDVRAGRSLQAGEAAWNAGEVERAGSLLGESLSLDRSPRTRARALQLQGEIAVRCGSLEQARTILLAATDEISAVDPDQAVVLLAEAINACLYLGDAAAAVSVAERIEALLTGELSSDAVIVATMAAGMARVLAGLGGTDQIRTAVQMLSGSTPVSVRESRYAWVLQGPLFLRESGTGRQLVREAVDARRARAAVSALPHLLFYIARDEATTDQWDSAEADYAEAVDLARELGQTTELAASLAGLAWLEARLGREDACRGHVAEALELCMGQHINMGRAWAEFATGELELGLGRVQSAVATFSALASWLDSIGFMDVDLSPAPELVEALVRTGEVAAARKVAAEYISRAEAKAQPWALARAARVRGLLCADDQIDGCFSAALAVHGRTLDVFEEARTRLTYGARLRRGRRRVDARPQLRQALDCFVRLGARSWAEVARVELEATGETAHGVEDVDRLTPREMQIALLLGRGRTTREAAAALFLSPKTVEYHLRHIYTKLGIRSRSELTARLGVDAIDG
jgi:DNA-binding CsgD family transcriptional regulator/tetratricopeptide (TPR) repeat protein/antitoxin (DNA-binding transcriptional repressor) of toxin-antitoxin stability system